MNNRNHSTHELLFQVITQKKINEFYKRANIQTRILEKEINTVLKDAYCEINI